MRSTSVSSGLVVAILLCAVGAAAIGVVLTPPPVDGEPTPTGTLHVSLFAGTPGATDGQGQSPETVVARSLTATAAGRGSQSMSTSVPAATVTAIAGRIATASSGIFVPGTTGARAASATVSPTVTATPLAATATPVPATATTAATATTPPAPAAAPSVIPDAAPIYAQVSPAVVMISNPAQRLPQSHSAGIASGTIYDAQGYIVTADRVVLGSQPGTLATQVDVVLPDGKQVTGKVVGRDGVTGLGVVKIDPSAVSAAITFADASHLTVGTPVVAIGSPLQFSATVTQGTISGLNRAVGEQSGLIQTSVSASSGMYGGPLVDMNGNIIGILTLNIHDDNATYRVAFAVPSDAVQSVVAALVQTGKISRPSFGATIETLTPTRAAALGLKVNSGAYVSAVVKGGPADTAGLAAGDVITAVNDVAVTPGSPLGDATRALMPRQSVMLTVNRGGVVKQIALTLGDTASS